MQDDILSMQVKYPRGLFWKNVTLQTPDMLQLFSSTLSG